jgi:hypothetical protein
MSQRPLLLALVLSGCAPATAVLDPAGSEPSDAAAEDGLVDAGASEQDTDSEGSAAEPDGDPGGTDDSGGDGGDDGSEVDDDPVPVDVVDSGTWVATAASIEDDPCQFDQLLSTYLRLDLLELLPGEFAVEGSPEGFEIEALGYGADGPIDCAVEDDGAFACEDQFVEPLDYSLGELGWVYQIRFFGVVEDSGRVRGEAVVDYPSVDSDTAWVLDAVGLDISECTQTFYLELQRGA